MSNSDLIAKLEKNRRILQAGQHRAIIPTPQASKQLQLDGDLDVRGMEFIINYPDVLRDENYSWNVGEAIKFCCELQQHLSVMCPVFVGLTGGVLFRGASSKDIDVILYPGKTSRKPRPQDLDAYLLEFGLANERKRRGSAEGWGPSGDEKDVRVYDYKGKRVDIFFLNF